jgi:DNA polymerase III subunit gamma/tau
VERVAELFGEEDLTRHLQIMLRTHGELGYKQEQRFHLELGLLKMAHAQKLLPIEQLLSEAAGPSTIAGGTGSGPKAFARPSIVPSASGGEGRRAEAVSPARPNSVSPFAADSARKNDPRQEFASDPVSAGSTRMGASGNSAARVVLGATALADPSEAEPVQVQANPGENEAEVPTNPSNGTPVSLSVSSAAAVMPGGATPPVARVRQAVLQALADGNQRILVSMLDAGEWAVEANEIVIRVSESQTVVDMSLSAEARKLAIASGSGVLGRAVKLKIVPGATVAPSAGKRNGALKAGGAASGPGGRSRAEQDSVVRRLQEKFGAEIRTVIDYKEKR